METEKTVQDGKITNEELGTLQRKLDEVKLRTKKGLPLPLVLNKLQQLIETSFKITPKPFDLSMLGDGWEELEGEKDKRSANLQEVDLLKVKFVSCLETGEALIKGEEKLCRLKESGDVLHGSALFMALWEDYQEKKENSLLEQLYQTGLIKGYLDFPGNVFRSPDGRRCVLYFARDSADGWRWLAFWLERGWRVGDLSVVSPAIVS